MKVAQVLKSRLKSTGVKRQKRSKIRSGCVARCGDANGKTNCEKYMGQNYSFKITHIKKSKEFLDVVYQKKLHLLINLKKSNKII